MNDFSKVTIYNDPELPSLMSKRKDSKDIDEKAEFKKWLDDNGNRYLRNSHMIIDMADYPECIAATILGYRKNLGLYFTETRVAK